MEAKISVYLKKLQGNLGRAGERCSKKIGEKRKEKEWPITWRKSGTVALFCEGGVRPEGRITGKMRIRERGEGRRIRGKLIGNNYDTASRVFMGSSCPHELAQKTAK